MFRHQHSLGRELLQNPLEGLSQHKRKGVVTKALPHEAKLGLELQDLVDIFIRHERTRVAAMFRHQQCLGRELLQNPLEVLSQHKRRRVATTIRRYKQAIFSIGKGKHVGYTN